MTFVEENKKLLVALLVVLVLVLVYMNRDKLLSDSVNKQVDSVERKLKSCNSAVASVTPAPVAAVAGAAAGVAVAGANVVNNAANAVVASTAPAAPAPTLSSALEKRDSFMGDSNAVDVGEDVQDWQDYLRSAGLDSSVSDNHGAWVDDLNRLTTTASVNTVFEPTDLVPFVGLRRTDYARVKVGDESRTVPGMTASELPSKNSTYII